MPPRKNLQKSAKGQQSLFSYISEKKPPQSQPPSSINGLQEKETPFLDLSMMSRNLLSGHQEIENEEEQGKPLNDQILLMKLIAIQKAEEEQKDEFKSRDNGIIDIKPSDDIEDK